MGIGKRGKKGAVENIKKCPQCNSDNVTYYMGGQLGMWQCKDCDYTGALILEEDAKL